MSTVNLVIVGTGLAAELHHRSLESLRNEGVRLSAVCHYDRNQFESIGERFGVSCLSFEETLADDTVDAMCICTPSGLHAEQVVAAIRAGKHVLVEKPMALSLKEADRMIAACDETGVKLGMVYQRRAEPKYRAVYEQIRSGRFGRLTLGALTMPYRRDQTYYDQAAWRGTWAQDGGGVLMNQGIHLIDLLVWYMGDPVDVRAHADTLGRAIEVEDVISATLRFADGSLATVAATTTAGSPGPHRLEIIGTKGRIVIDGEHVQSWANSDVDRDRLSHHHRPGIDEPGEAGAAADPAAISLSGHRGILLDFVRAIREDRPAMIDGREGRRSLQAVLALYDAAGLSSQRS